MTLRSDLNTLQVQHFGTAK